MKKSKNKKSNTQKDSVPVGFEELFVRAFEDQDQAQKVKK
jgi:hypothetical protein